MSIATQIERLQGVRDQIRTKMVGLGLSENTDLLQDLADDLDSVNKISPTNNGTTDPGTGYTNVDTLDRSTSTRYIKVPKGYNNADRKFTVSGVANGAYSASVASHTTSNATASSNVSGSIVNITSATKPSTGNDGSDYFTITPKLTTAAGSSKATGKATISTAGYIAAGNTTSSESSKSVGVTASQGSSYYLKAGSYSASVASHEVTNATAGSSVAGSITNITSTTKPSAGTDGTNYYTITPKLTTGAGSSKATGKATISANGFLGVGNKTSSESSKSVGVTASQGDSYYLPAGSYSASVSSHTTSNATASSSVTGSITNVTSTTKPSGTDGTNYYTINPKLTTGAGSSKATGKATISTAGYIATGNTTSEESSKSVGVTASQGDSYYLKAGSYSASVASHTTTNASASSSVTGSITGVATTTKPSGTDGTNYYTITPKLATGAGSSKATGKATIDTSGYLATGSATSSESSKTVSVTATQGSDYYLKAGSYSASVSSHTTSNATASSSVTGSVTNIATTTAPTSGTDGTDYYTITPNLTTTKGSSKATGKATVGTAGYLVTGSTTSSESSVDVGVTATQGDNYYLKKGSYSASVASHTASNATASSSVTGSITNIVTSTKPSTGTDGTDYYTITPKLTTTKGSSKAKGKAAVDTAGYLATGNTTSSESSVDVGVTATQGDSYYLKASSVTKEDPGTSYANKATVTPSTSAQYVKVTAGYLPNSKITVEAIPNQKGKDDVTASVTAGISDITSINASQVTDGVTVTASASGSTVVPVGYYSTQVSKTPSNSKSTTIKPKLAGTNGSIELTAGTSAFTKTSTADYSNGFITSVKVNPTPSETKGFTPTMAGGTVSPTSGKLLSSVTVKGIPHTSITLLSGSWKSDSNVTIGKYYYDVSSAMFTASNNLYVMPDSASTAQSFGVYAYSQSKASGAILGTLQFRAIEKPTSDLTYTVYYLS